MPALPGWNSIETATTLRNFFELAGIILFLVVVVCELLAYAYGHRKDSLVDDAASLAAIAQQQKDEAAEIKHTAEVNALREQLSAAAQQAAAATKQIAEDHSTRNQLRAFLAQIDPQILREIDAGQTELTIRMQAPDLDRLGIFMTMPGGDALIRITGYGQTFTDTVISNGSLGPQAPVAWQRQVRVEVSPLLKAAN